MTDIKPWYLSRTIWAAVVTVASALVGLFGFSASEVDQSSVVDAVLQTVAAIAGLVALFGRLSATSRIG